MGLNQFDCVMPERIGPDLSVTELVGAPRGHRRSPTETSIKDGRTN